MSIQDKEIMIRTEGFFRLRQMLSKELFREDPPELLSEDSARWELLQEQVLE